MSASPIVVFSLIVTSHTKYPTAICVTPTAHFSLAGTGSLVQRVPDSQPLVPPDYRCVSAATSWMGGSLPAVSEGQVSRMVYFLIQWYLPPSGFIFNPGAELWPVFRVQFETNIFYLLSPLWWSKLKATMNRCARYNN